MKVVVEDMEVAGEEDAEGTVEEVGMVGMEDATAALEVEMVVTEGETVALEAGAVDMEAADVVEGTVVADAAVATVVGKGTNHRTGLYLCVV